MIVYTVKLVKSNSKVTGTFSSEYFPRKFRYKWDAEKVANAVRALDGEVTVERNVHKKREGIK